MNRLDCEREPLVIEAARSGQWDDELRNHAASCPVCADSLLVAPFLEGLAGRDRRESSVPEAGRVWWKAQLLARREAVKRVDEPITILERVAFACAFLSLVGLGIWRWDWIGDRLRGFADVWPASGYPGQEFVVSLWQQSSLIMIVGGSVLLLWLSFLAYLVWTEE